MIASDRFKGRPCEHRAEREYRVEPIAAQCRGDKALGDGGVLEVYVEHAPRAPSAASKPRQRLLERGVADLVDDAERPTHVVGA